MCKTAIHVNKGTKMSLDSNYPSPPPPIVTMDTRELFLLTLTF